ncbi:MAG: YbgC/FadM family acyl-CoA thioesterase [Alphaproteobacteria bacterium]|nr:YbgC/FadM family acyl-CoA thioesterase [Alphaproteobacteria bacterium]
MRKRQNGKIIRHINMTPEHPNIMADGDADPRPLHRYQFRVVYADTDAGGVVYHARYLDIAERARAEMMLDLDLGAYLPNADAHKQDAHNQGQSNFLVVRRIDIDYLKPARLYDLVTITSYVNKLGGSSLDLRQEISANGHLLARANIILVWIDGQFRPQRLPQHVRDVLLNAATG